MSHDYCGECRHCHALNSYAVFDCRACGARLPWADALTQKLFEGQNVAASLAAPSPSVVPQSPITPQSLTSQNLTPQGLTPPATQPQWAKPSPSASVPPSLLTPVAAPLIAKAACAQCGAEHSADATFCLRCGARLHSAPALQAVQIVPDAVQKTQTTVPSLSGNSSVQWPLGLSQPAAPLATPAASLLSPQQNVNVNVVTHQQDSIAIKQKKRGGFATRLALVLFMIGGYLIMVNAPFEAWMFFMFAGAAVCVLRAI